MGLHWQHNAVQRMGRLIVMAVLMWSSATATAPHVLSQPGGSAVAAPGVTAAFEGCQQTDPYNVEKHPDGSTTYHYKVDGLETTETTPPPGFDVSSATAEQLSIYGLPPRPTNPAALDSWLAGVTGIDLSSPSGVCTATTDIPNPTIVIDGHYGGLEITPYSGHPYVGAYSNNRVFIPVVPGCASPQGEASWVGVQTDIVGKSSGLLQNGSYRYSGINNGYPVFFWYYQRENSDTGSLHFALIEVHSGDLAYYETYYDLVTETVTFYWSDMTRHTGGSKDVELGNLAYWDGHFADFIDEKLGDGNLNRYGSIGWGGAYVEGTAGGDFPGNLPHNFYRTVNHTLDQNLDYGLLSSDNWNDYWHGCD